MGAPPLPPQTSDGAIYRHDLTLEINGQKCVGTCVVPMADRYKVVIYPHGKIDRIMWQTCHQESVVDSPKSGWFDKKYGFEFRQAAGIEDSKACALEVGVFEERKKRNGWAVVDFQDARPETSLPASLKCNGSVFSTTGVSICQSASGLIQEIAFGTPVIVRPSPECAVLTTKDEKTYTFPLAKGKCTYYFVSNLKTDKGVRRMHRLNTIGYSEVPVKE